MSLWESLDDARRRPFVGLSAPIVLGVFLFLYVGLTHRTRQLDGRRRIVVPTPRGTDLGTNPVATLRRGESGWRVARCEAPARCADNEIDLGASVLRVARVRCHDGICERVPEGRPGGRWVAYVAGMRPYCGAANGETPLRIAGVSDEAPSHEWLDLRLRCIHGRPVLATAGTTFAGATWRYRGGSDEPCSGQEVYSPGNELSRQNAFKLDLCRPGRRRSIWTLSGRNDGLLHWETMRDAIGLAGGGFEPLDRPHDVSVDGEEVEVIDERAAPHGFIPTRFVGRDFREQVDALRAAGLLRYNVERRVVELVNPNLAERDSPEAQELWRGFAGHAALRRLMDAVNEDFRNGRFQQGQSRAFVFDTGVELACVAAGDACLHENAWRARRVPVALTGVRWHEIERDLQQPERTRRRALPTLNSGAVLARAARTGGLDAANVVLTLRLPVEGGYHEQIFEGTGDLMFSLSRARPDARRHPRWTRHAVSAARPADADLLRSATSNGWIVRPQAPAGRWSVHVEAGPRRAEAVWSCAGDEAQCPTVEGASRFWIRERGVQQITGDGRSGPAFVERDAIAFAVPSQEPPLDLGSGDVIRFSQLPGTEVRVALARSDLAVGGGGSQSARGYPLGDAARDVVGATGLDESIDAFITARRATSEEAGAEVMTLDADLQRAVYLRLRAAQSLILAQPIDRVDRRDSFAVVLDADNGDVLAAATVSGRPAPTSPAPSAAASRPPITDGELLRPGFFGRWRRNNANQSLTSGQRFTLTRDEVARLRGEAVAAPGEGILSDVFRPSRSPLLDREYVLGSAMKPLVALLASGADGPPPRAYAPEVGGCCANDGGPQGTLVFGHRGNPRPPTIHCWRAHAGSGGDRGCAVPLRAAIAQSCDIHFARLAITSFRDYAMSTASGGTMIQMMPDPAAPWFVRGLARSFGLIGAAPDEALACPASAALRDLRHGDGDVWRWEIVPGRTVDTGVFDLSMDARCGVNLAWFGSLGFGQHIALTPMHAASLFSRVVRRDLRPVVPRMLTSTPVALRPPIGASGTIETAVLNGLRDVLGAPEGTALPDVRTALQVSASRYGVELFAKTGTPQEDDPRDHDHQLVHKVFVVMTRPREGEPSDATGGQGSAARRRLVVLVYFDRVRANDGGERGLDGIAQRVAAGILGDLVELELGPAPVAARVQDSRAGSSRVDPAQRRPRRPLRRTRGR